MGRKVGVVIRESQEPCRARFQSRLRVARKPRTWSGRPPRGATAGTGAPARCQGSPGGRQGGRGHTTARGAVDLANVRSFGAVSHSLPLFSFSSSLGGAERRRVQLARLEQQAVARRRGGARRRLVNAFVDRVATHQVRVVSSPRPARQVGARSARANDFSRPEAQGVAHGVHKGPHGRALDAKPVMHHRSKTFTDRRWVFADSNHPSFEKSDPPQPVAEHGELRVVRSDMRPGPSLNTSGGPTKTRRKQPRAVGESSEAM